MNLKIERLNSTFVKELSYIIATETKDKDIKNACITDCKITNDLSFAKVYYTVFNKDRLKETSVALKNASGFLRTKLCERVDIRHTPELIFTYDESIEYGQKIENIIEKIHQDEIDK